MSTSYRARWLYLVTCIAPILGLATLPAVARTDTGSARAARVSPHLQFASGGHIVGFASDGYYAAAATHTLRVHFAGANAVTPIGVSASSLAGTAPPLGRVTYANLWEGIALACEAPASGILQSTYTLLPGANPARIRLRYNAPIAITPDGRLTAAYDSGCITESAPIAWQEIDGRRVDVEVRFQRHGTDAVGFALGAFDPAHNVIIDPVTRWNTFLGGSGDDYGTGIVLDESGNIYVVGSSDGPWGSPALPYSASYDVYVAKLDASGNLLWNTFLGGTFDDYGNGIALDGTGNVYVTGRSEGDWSTTAPPVSPYNDVDAFVAQLDSNGALLWHTFSGGNGSETGAGVDVDGLGNVFVTGYSDGSWGAPLNGHGGGPDDAFVALLDATGNLTWNTFLGGSGTNRGASIAVDGNGDIYVTGSSDAAWGSPVRAYTNLTDGFVAKLDSIGTLTWNTFLGGSGADQGSSLAIDGTGNVYVAGASAGTWGLPARPYTPSVGDGFVAKLDSATGSLTWNTFLGGNGDDRCDGIVEDGNGNVFVTGTGSSAWGTPIQGYAGGPSDAFIAQLAQSGALVLNSFLGSSMRDESGSLAVYGTAGVFVVGRSNDTWGSPVRRYTPLPGNNYDAFVAAIDIVAPRAASFILDTPAISPTSADALVFRVVFSEPVTGVGPTDFTSNGTTATVAAVAPASTSEYQITLSGGDLATLNGTVGLDFAAAPTIADLAGNALVKAEPPVDETYTVDNVAPDVSIDLPAPPSPTASTEASLAFSSTDPTAVFECDLDGGGFAPGTSPQQYTGLTGGSHTFTVHAIDPAGNVGTATHTWMVDVTAPTVRSITRAGADPTSASVVDFTVTFSEPVTGVDVSGGTNFSLATTGISGAMVTGVTGSDAAYTVTVSTGSGFGTIRLDLTSLGAIADSVGNPLGGTFTGGEAYTIVPPEPQFLRGDANADHNRNIADAIFLLTHLFAKGPAPGCRDTGDANDDGNLNIADAIKLLAHLFARAGPLEPPFEKCGIDPTPDGQDCAEYVFCPR